MLYSSGVPSRVPDDADELQGVSRDRAAGSENKACQQLVKHVSTLLTYADVC
jgi:hypothetical protein